MDNLLKDGILNRKRKYSKMKDLTKTYKMLKDVIGIIGHCDICDVIHFFTNNVQQMRPFLEQLDYMQNYWVSVKVELCDNCSEKNIKFYDHAFQAESLLLKLNGGKLYIPFPEDGYGIYLYGYFKIDNINRYHKHNAYLEKYNDLKNTIKMANVSEEFKNNYLDTHLIKDFILMTTKI